MVLTTFHPIVQRWFESALGSPTAPQREGWPHIRAGHHTLIAAPTGTGKTLAAFLGALDGLLRQESALRDETQVLYVSPLRALSNDVQKNLEAPLAAIRALDPTLPEVRVLVRTGDTSASQRTKMARKPPHVLVTTPESLYILLTSQSGRAMLRTVRTVIVDEIHALARDKRGSHLALSLERLEALCASDANPSACSSSLLSHSDLPQSTPASSPAHSSSSSTEPVSSQSHSVASQTDAIVPEPRSHLQRIGLSATQKPLETVARLLVGEGRECALVDAGHLRAMDLSVVVPDTPLSAVCSHEQWGELYKKMAALVRAHRTTLVFVATRKQAERLAARLSDELGRENVGCHHGSLSKETRLRAEQRLKAGELRVLVATASLELGIDIGDVDLVCQVGSARSIATLLQRVGRAGHGVDRFPIGRLFPLTLDEAVEAVALLRAVRRRELDRTPTPPAALDILAQQIVAACVAEEWRESDLFECFRRAFPYRELTRDEFDAVVALHTQGRSALLHRDAVGARLMATKRARIPAVTSGGAIPDNADYRVLLEPAETFIGTLNEDFAVEATRGDVFQLGNASWQILKIEPGVVRVSDAQGAPPTLPFWLGEAPARTSELTSEIGAVREHGHDVNWILSEIGEAESALPRGIASTPPTRIDRDDIRAENASAAEQVAEYLRSGREALGAMPDRSTMVLERFFDESGGMQLVLHSLHGSRVNRALGLALRKRFCRSFGFELQAAANEEAIVLSLSEQHSFELAGVFDYLRASSARELLIQALLDAPMFTARWRWNASRALLLPRFSGGKRVPPPIARMRAEDLLGRCFPQAIACGETLPPGDVEVPMDHPIVKQTVEDCLHEAMDIDGFLDVLARLGDGRITKHCIDRPEPSVLARGILAAQPYAFLDDAPLEERRTQAVRTRRALEPKTADDLGALDPSAVERVRDEIWPEPDNAEELHEALLWMGFATDAEAGAWRPWLDELARAGRVEHVGSRWFATEAPRSGKEVLRGRLEALGPIDVDDPLIGEFSSEIRALESEGVVLMARLPRDESSSTRSSPRRDDSRTRAENARDDDVTREESMRSADMRASASSARSALAAERTANASSAGRACWCMRRLLARIHRYTLDRLRTAIQPASAAEFLRFLAHWQHVAPLARLDGPRGVATVIDQLAGFQAPAQAWEKHIFPARVNGYQSRWLEELALSGEIAWGRLWGAGASAARSIPITFLRRDSMQAWIELEPRFDVADLRGDAGTLHEILLRRGPSFVTDLARESRLLPSRLETALAELAGHGLATCDSFSGLSALFAHGSRAVRRSRDTRARSIAPAGRWSLLDARAEFDAAESDEARRLERAELVARALLARTGVVFRRTILREKIPVPWRDLLIAMRRMEARGEIHGGRFVNGFHGEQYALPQAVQALRALRRAAPAEPVFVDACDPLNFVGILTPDPRVASNAKKRVPVTAA
jgi:ATP-dependent Lhr-like helicase